MPPKLIHLVRKGCVQPQWYYMTGKEEARYVYCRTYPVTDFTYDFKEANCTDCLKHYVDIIVRKHAK